MWHRYLVGLVAGLVSASLFAASAQAQSSAKEPFIGSWKVVSFKAATGDKVSYPLGEHPVGFVGITPDRFWVMLVDSTRKAPAAATLTDAEAVTMMRTSTAYTGKYAASATPDGVKFTIHVDSAANQALDGTDRIVFVHVEENKLTIRSPAIVIPTTGQTSVIETEFMKAD
jgi:Lipocalin-like domain